MTEPAGDEKIAGTLNRDRLLILFSYLIRKTININNKPDLIRTVRSMGYSLQPPAE